MTIQQLFGELHALVFQDPCILLDATIQGHADLPRPREHLRILNRGFVIERVRAAGRVALHDVQRVAMEVAGAVEPRLIVHETGHVDHERFALPAPVRPPHPTIAGGLRRGTHIDDANRASVFVRQSGCSAETGRFERDTGGRWRVARPADST